MIKSNLIFLIVIGLLSLAIKEAASVDYCDALQKSLMFYKAQRAGKLPDTDIPWRGDSVLIDGDLMGGYFDAGDGVKFGLPMAYTMTMLSWAFIQYESNIEKCGLTDLYLEDIKWGTDWLIAAHTGDNEFAAQVGDGNIDHSWWGPPELMNLSRPVFYINATSPGTEVAMEAAAALAAASIVYATRDSSYSSTLLTHAKQLHDFGDTYRGVYTDAVPNAVAFYNSYSGYNDEIVWGTIWLYKATQDASLLTKAKADYASFGIGSMAQANSHDWDLKAPGCTILMSQITGDDTYKTDAEGFLNWWLPDGGISYTPGGLAFRQQWGPLRYAMTASFLATVYGGDTYLQFAQNQLGYALGDNPMKISYVIGVGDTYPINPHHRASHHSLDNNINDPVLNTYELTGALVGGPSQDDSYVDDRTDYVRNEVADDYNAGLVGVLAAFVDTSATPAPTTTAAPSSSSSGETTPTTTPTDTSAPTSTPTDTSAPTTTPTDTSAPTTAPASGLEIYKNGLQNSFQDWSWGEHNLQDTSNVNDGSSSSISFTPQNWNALFIGANEGIDTSKYSQLSFYLMTSDSSTPNLSLAIIKNSAKLQSKTLTEALAGQSLVANQWTLITMKFADYGASNTMIDGFWIQDMSGTAQSTIYISDITAN